MQGRQFFLTFEEQVAADKSRLEAQAARLPAGRKKAELLRKIRQLETQRTSAIGFHLRGFGLRRIET